MENESIIAAMVTYCAEIFDDMYIVDPEVRKQVAKLLVEGEDLFVATERKFDVDRLAEFIPNPVGEIDTRLTVRLSAGVDNAQRAQIVQQNPDVQISFVDTTRMPHGTAYAQRYIDTRRMARKIPSTQKSVIDIGGNYTMHPGLQSHFDVHCCTLRTGSLEQHRQTQREVKIRYGAEHCDWCEGGVENCDYVAQWFIMVHVLPEINPALWPEIFRKHMFTEGDSVHHHDVAFDAGDTAGYMPYAGMHWKVNGDTVHYDFDNDSSFYYSHKLEYVKAYSAPFTASAQDWEYVVFYDILSVSGDRIESHFTRLEKITIGYTMQRPLLRWVGGDGDVMVTVPIFDESRGRSVRDPLAYRAELVPVPVMLYNQAFMKGTANDTHRPDTPLSRDDLRNAIRTYNADRSLNGTEYTQRLKYSAEDVDIMADGIYLAAVTQTTYNKLVTAKLTDQMVRMQRRWGHEGLLSLIGSCITTATLAPFVKLADNTQDLLDVVSLWVRQNTGRSEVLTAPQPRKPYVLMPPAKFDVDQGFVGFELDQRRSDDQQAAVPDNADTRKAYYKIYRDEMPDDIRKQFEQELFDGEVPDRSDYSSDSVVDTEEDDELPILEDPEQVAFEDREKWIDAFSKLQAEAPDELRGAGEPTEGTLAEVHADSPKALLEFALHCFDLHMNVHAKVLENLAEHFRVDTILHNRVRETNEIREIGAVFIKVSADGYLQYGESDNVHGAVVDPFTKRFIIVQNRAGGPYVGRVSTDVVYATNDLRIYNGRRLGVAAMNLYNRLGPDGIKKALANVEFELVDGIAGSGKTRSLTSELSVKDVFATGPRASAASVRAWCNSQPRFKGMEKEIDARFRTLDSHLLLKHPRLAETAYVDEGLMLHDGGTVFLALETRAKRVKVSGDNAQIGLIDRGGGYGKLLYAKRMKWSKITYLNQSDRMPMDATFMCRQFYPVWRQALIKTRSPVRRSFEFVHAPDLNDPRFSERITSATYVTLLQGDKVTQSRRHGFVDAKHVEPGTDGGNSTVCTVHEAQGETYPVTMAIRLNARSSDIFSSKNHQYVWISRHTQLLRYTSVSSAAQCPFARLVQKAIEVPEEALDEVSAPADEKYLANVLAERERVGKYVMLIN